MSKHNYVIFPLYACSIESFSVTTGFIVWRLKLIIIVCFLQTFRIKKFLEKPKAHETSSRLASPVKNNAPPTDHTLFIVSSLGILLLQKNNVTYDCTIY